MCRWYKLWEEQYQFIDAPAIQQNELSPTTGSGGPVGAQHAARCTKNVPAATELPVRARGGEVGPIGIVKASAFATGSTLRDPKTSSAQVDVTSFSAPLSPQDVPGSREHVVAEVCFPGSALGTARPMVKDKTKGIGATTGPPPWVMISQQHRAPCSCTDEATKHERERNPCQDLQCVKYTYFDTMRHYAEVRGVMTMTTFALKDGMLCVDPNGDEALLVASFGGARQHSDGRVEVRLHLLRPSSAFTKPSPGPART